MPNLLQSFYTKFSGGSGSAANNDPHFNFSRNYLCAMSFSFPKGIPFPTEYSLQDITLLSQAVNTPDIELSGVERESTVEVKNLGGSWTGVGEVNIQPTDNTFAISLIDTVRPVHEMFFLPWLKYVVEANRRPPASEVGNYGADQSYPFSRAQLRIFFFNNISTPSLNDSTTITQDSNIALEYLIDGVFPVEIENRKMAYGEQTKLVRDVKFAFNRIDCVTLPNVNPSNKGLAYATVGKVTSASTFKGQPYHAALHNCERTARGQHQPHRRAAERGRSRTVWSESRRNSQSRAQRRSQRSTSSSRHRQHRDWEPS